MRKQEKPNEKNAREAFTNILNTITGIDYALKCRPEETKSGEIDFVLCPKVEAASAPHVAVEHTIIEAYEGQLQYNNQLYEIVAAVNRRCQATLPSDRYFALTIPPFLVRGTPREINQLVAEISGWVVKVAESSPIIRSNQFNQYISRTYKGHEVRLTWGDPFSVLDINVGARPTTPPDLAASRQRRFHKALRGKLPKLVKYRDHGCETALVLEGIINSSLFSGQDSWNQLIPQDVDSEFMKIDYGVALVSNNGVMVVGGIWKLKSNLYSTIPNELRFPVYRMARYTP